MKKAILIPLMLIAAIQLKAQQQATFKLVYMPKTTYTDKRDMNMLMNMEAGGQNIAMNMTMNSVATTETGAPDKNKNIAVKISNKTTDIKMTMNGNEMPGSAIPPVTIVAYGKYSGDGKLAIDSVAGQKMNDSLRTAMVKMVETMQNNIKFPDHPIKVGESFSVDAPFDMGAMMHMGAGNKMTIKMTYKLVSIANDIAAFDIAENMDIDLSKSDVAAAVPGMTMVMKGMGTGAMSYDMKKQFLLTMVNTVDMDFDMSVSGQAIKGKGTVATKDNVVVAGN